MSHPKVLDPARSVLVVIDLQEAFRQAIKDFDEVANQTSKAVRGFQILDVPVIVTEQYPKGLGRTAQEVLSVLPDDVEIIEKTTFSSCGASSFLTKLDEIGAKQIVLAGLETHICVNQTAHDLLDKGFDVHILTDCVCSRFEQNKQAALTKMQMNGVSPTCVEMALFELMRDSKHEQFREIQKLIK